MLGPMRQLVIAAAVAAAPACASLTGEGADDAASCGGQGGYWQASYVELSGTCGAFEGHSVDLGPHHSLYAGYRTYGDGETVTDEALIRDCRLRFTQWVERDRVLIAQIDGKDLRFHASDTIRGEAELQRFAPDGEVMCMGRYDLTLELPDAGP